MTTYPPTVDVIGAADLMKVHPQTVLDKIGAGELRAAKMGRSYVLMTKDVLAAIEAEIARQMGERMRSPLKPGQVSCPRRARRSATTA